MYNCVKDDAHHFCCYLIHHKNLYLNRTCGICSTTDRFFLHFMYLNPILKIQNAFYIVSNIIFKNKGNEYTNFMYVIGLRSKLKFLVFRRRVIQGFPISSVI